MKQKTYEGYGINNMLIIAKRYGLNMSNSDLYIKDTSDLNSKWTIRIKGSKNENTCL